MKGHFHVDLQKAPHHPHDPPCRCRRLVLPILAEYARLCGGRDPAGRAEKDWDLFCKRVDVAKVYSYALDDMLAELKADGLPEHAIAASLVKSIKKEVVKELIRQTEIRFKDGAPASKSLLDKPVKTLTAYAGSSALSLTDIFKIEEADGKAIAYVQLEDKDLSRDFIWQVQLEKDVNGLWTATRILNFTDYLKERMDG